MTTRSPTRSKAVLFCAVCGHQSPPDGDWHESMRRDDQRLALVCPSCDEIVTTRSAREASPEALAVD